MRYRLIATDIDGTLLNDRNEVTPRARAAIAEWCPGVRSRSQGALDPPSTGKDLALRVLREIRALDPNINVGAELAHEWHIDRIDQRLRQLLATGRILELPVEGHLEHAVAVTTRGVSKLYFVVPPAIRAAAEQRFAVAGLAISVTSSGSAGEGLCFVDVQAPGVSKGAGWAEAVERHALADYPAESA